MWRRILGIFLCFSVHAQITLTTENDLLWSDRNFTHGTQLAYNSGDKQYFIFQNIYTPEDIQSIELNKNDRRYSGILALGVELKKGREYGGIVDRYSAGMLGPSAHAEWSQNTVHSIRNIPTAKGWGNNQLDDRPVFLFSREIIVINDSPNFQVGQSLKLDGGNLFTGVKYSIPVRIGYNLQDYSSNRIKIEAANDLSFGLEWISAAQYVAYDATLEGVNKEEVYGEYSIGGFLNFKKFGVGIYRVTRTEQWEDGEGSNFGTISLKF